jgi:hypothetical protein
MLRDVTADSNEAKVRFVAANILAERDEVL